MQELKLIGVIFCQGPGEALGRNDMHCDRLSDGDVINGPSCLSREDTSGWGGLSPACTPHTLSGSIQLVRVLFASPGPLRCVQGRNEMILLDSSFLCWT